MSSENEPAKLLLPYLQRADELQKHDPLVAYYCRLHAMERGLKIPTKERTKTTNALLVSLMAQLEKDKKSLTLGPEDQLHVEGFALNVFSKADKQDRAGKADLNTAKTFYAASIFFEILNQFGELQPDLEQKQKYAAWKAADIRKALKEGRKPVPGPPGDNDDPSLTSMASSGEYDISPMRPDSSQVNPSTTISPDSVVFSQPYNNPQHSTSAHLLSPPSNTTQSPSNITTPQHYPDGCPPDNYNQPTTYNISERYPHLQPYNSEPYQSEPQQHLPQHYPSQDIPSQSYPNFQSYPSFTESSLPTAPSRYPSYYQGLDASYPNYQGSVNSYQGSEAQYDSVVRNGYGSIPEASSTATQKYEYDSNYQPPPEQIAEAQKAARFAVGALAFDDVFVAVDHLKKALELLTKPSAGH